MDSYGADLANQDSQPERGDTRICFNHRFQCTRFPALPVIYRGKVGSLRLQARSAARGHTQSTKSFLAWTYRIGQPLGNKIVLPRSLERHSDSVRENTDIAIMNSLQKVIFFLWDTCWFALQTLVTEVLYVAQSPQQPGQNSGRQGDLQGQIMVLTGGSFGIGAAVCRQWVELGGSCVVLSRSKPNMQNSDETQTQWIPCDLASLESVNAAADKLATELPFVNALVCCAGTMMPDPHIKSKDGQDLSFQVNHLSHALLSLRLAPLMGSTSSVVFVSSVAHVAARGILALPTDGAAAGAAAAGSVYSQPSSYSSASAAYAESKLANIVWASQFARHLSTARPPADLPDVASLHPGVVNTRLYRHMPPPFSWLQQALAPLLFRRADDPAREILALAARCAGAAGGRNPCHKMGQYHVRGASIQPAAIAKDSILGAALWDYTLQAVGVPAAVAEQLLAQAPRSGSEHRSR